MIELTEIYRSPDRRALTEERPILINPRHVVSVRSSEAFKDYPAPLYRLVVATGDVHFVLDPTGSDVGIEGLQRALAQEAA